MPGGADTAFGFKFWQCSGTLLLQSQHSWRRPGWWWRRCRRSCRDSPSLVDIIIWSISAFDRSRHSWRRPEGGGGAAAAAFRVRASRRLCFGASSLQEPAFLEAAWLGVQTLQAQLQRVLSLICNTSSPSFCVNETRRSWRRPGWWCTSCRLYSHPWHLVIVLEVQKVVLLECRSQRSWRRPGWWCRRCRRSCGTTNRRRIASRSCPTPAAARPSATQVGHTLEKTAPRFA